MSDVRGGWAGSGRRWSMEQGAEVLLEGRLTREDADGGGRGDPGGG